MESVDLLGPSAVLAQFEDPRPQLIEIAQILIFPYRAEALVPARRPSGPVDRHLDQLRPPQDGDDDPFYQVPDDRLTVLRRRARRLPERRQVRGHGPDRRHIGLRERW